MENQTVPTTPSPEPATTPQKTKISLLIGMMVLVLILLASTGYLAFQNYQLRKEISQLQSSPSPTPTLDPTANWIIYTSDSFSFSYPKDFQYIKYENGVVGFFDNTDAYQACLKYIQQKTKNIDSPCFQDKFNFNGFRTLSQGEYQNFLNSRIDPKEYIDSQIRKWQTDWIEAEAYNFEAVTNFDSKYYSVFFQGNKTTLSDRNFFNQILSTFKFLSSGSQAAAPTIVFLPSLSNSDRKTDRDIITARVINPFIDFQKDLDPTQQIVSITVEDNKEESSKSQYPFSFTAIFKNGSNTQLLLSQTNGVLNWFEPTCMGCKLTPQFIQKYPEIAKQFDRVYGNNP